MAHYSLDLGKSCAYFRIAMMNATKGTWQALLAMVSTNTIQVVLFLTMCSGLVPAQDSKVTEGREKTVLTGKVKFFEELRNTLPEIGGGGITHYGGQGVEMPDGERVTFTELHDIAREFGPDSDKEALCFVGYLRDRDPHLRVVAYAGLDLYLLKNGVEGKEYWIGSAAEEVTKPTSREMFQAMIERFGALWRKRLGEK